MSVDPEFALRYRAVTELPDLLIAQDGSAVRTPDDWFEKRRPELAELIQLCEYGFLPPPPKQVHARLLHENQAAYAGKARLREFELTWETSFSLRLLLVTPAAAGAAPVFAGVNFSGNHSLVPDEGVAIPGGWMYGGKFNGGPENRATAEGRNLRASDWDIEANIEAGYAIATFYNGDLIEDEPALAFPRLSEFRSEHPIASPAAAATIAVWSWGLQRVVDFLISDPAVDSARIATVGHSRLGKTALLAAALDDRIALTIPSQAGCGGTSPARLTSEQLRANVESPQERFETTERITRAFPHWFCENFKSFNNRPEYLPYDHHAVVALCAPRPVLLSNASDDTWADPEGQFRVAQAAEPVFRLLGASGLETRKMPGSDEFTLGRLGFFLRPGGHAMTPAEWTVWRQYAARWL